MGKLINHGSDLFNFDQRVCSKQLLTSSENSTSKVEYDEYVVFKAPQDRDVPAESASVRTGDSSSHVAHRFSRDQTLGSVMLDLAFREGHSLDRNGEFRAPNEEDGGTQEDMEGRIRRIICFRRLGSPDVSDDLLSMTEEDLAALELHPATLQYATRTTTESRFWSPDNSRLSIILSFSEVPKTPCDFLSMTYDVSSRAATILVRQSWEPRRHNLDDLDEYDHRLESCRTHWAHPLIMPVVLLQVQFMRCEEAVSDNNSNVSSLELDVSNIAGFEGFEGSDPTSSRRLQRQLSHSKDGTEKGQSWGPLNMTNLMKKAHEVLKDSIKLLDTIRWMERAVKLLILCGDELAQRMGSTSQYNSDYYPPSPKFGEFDREPSPSPFLTVPSPRVFRPAPEPATDHLGSHWHEIRQYLDGLLRLCMGLETDRRMSEARCRAQIDIIYSKMAQEDNVLNARMAVASSRDSSSMKALAVITAIFLPGEFLGTLFGMSMFDWLAPNEEKNDAAVAGQGGGDDEHEAGTLSSMFWVYWALAVPLTLVTLLMWRAWWVNQDRYFRRHLSRDLSEERFWTADGKPRSLEHGFIHDFFYLSVRRDEKVRLAEDERTSKEAETMRAQWNGLPSSQGRPINLRQRRILDTRKHSLQRSRTSVAI